MSHFSNTKNLIPTVLFVAGLLFLSAGTVNAATVFGRDLKMGDYGQDVFKLQQVLNQNSLTRVAVGGPGSPGLETSYFGPRTYQAVVRFQDIYRTEVLAPAGLFRATGYVGPFTRNKLNQLTETGAPVPAFKVETNANAATGSQSHISQSTTIEPKIFGITPSRGGAGTEVTIRGEGFDLKDNDIYASYATLKGVASPDGKTIKVKVYEPFPDEFRTPPGFVETLQYGFVVENWNGRSNAVPFTFEL